MMITRARVFMAVPGGLFFLIAIMGVLSGCAKEQGQPAPGRFDNVFPIPKLPPPARYGNVLISRLTKSSTHPPVAFSHWVHRRYYTCRVCHFELEFAMKTNGTTEMTEAKIREGEYCGACHNDRLAFGVKEGTCAICHSGNAGSSDERFGELKDLPKSTYGNRVNWVKALRRKLIMPRQSVLNDDFEQIPFNANLKLDPEWRMIRTRASFPHQKHTDWLDCADCHPDIFNIRKKGTRFRMDAILKGNYCGACHLTVAFPIQECRRCHPDLK